MTKKDAPKLVLRAMAEEYAAARAATPEAVISHRKLAELLRSVTRRLTRSPSPGPSA